jgi:hypothetical protein
MVTISAAVSSGAEESINPRSKSKACAAEYPHLPWRLVNEFEAAAMLGVSVKFLRHQRQLNRPPRFRKLNGTTIRYKISDLEAYEAVQPGGGDAGDRKKAKLRHQR